MNTDKQSYSIEWLRFVNRSKDADMQDSYNKKKAHTCRDKHRSMTVAITKWTLDDDLAMVDSGLLRDRLAKHSSL